MVFIPRSEEAEKPSVSVRPFSIFFFLQLVNLCSGRLTRPDSSPHIRTSVKQICVWFINTNLHNTLAISCGMLVHMADRWPTVVCYQPFAKTRNRAAPLWISHIEHAVEYGYNNVNRHQPVPRINHIIFSRLSCFVCFGVCVLLNWHKCTTCPD